MGWALGLFIGIVVLRYSLISGIDMGFLENVFLTFWRVGTGIALIETCGKSEINDFQVHRNLRLNLNNTP